MGDNGKSQPVVLMNVILNGGSMQVKFKDNINTALLSHALRLANLQLDNMIIKNEEARSEKLGNLIKPSLTIPNDVLKRMRK